MTFHASNEQRAESVWDYPRPPRLEPTASELIVRHQGITIARTRRGLRLLETSHPPVYYLPPTDVRMDLLVPSPRRASFCEFKSMARYWSLRGGATHPSLVPVADVGWSYPDPTPAYAALKDHIAFYASRVDECLVDGERVEPQAGDFYGGWVTSWIRGPFKGPPGTLGW